jgi:K(+)-stimulated pyrophosphate-energized sodium pump
MTIDASLYQAIALICGLFAIGGSIVYYLKIKKLPTGNERMNFIADAIREGAMAYLSRQNKTVAMFAAVIAVLFFALGMYVDPTWIGIAIAFIVGAVFSAVAGYMGMAVTTLGNVRTAEAAKKGLNAALGVSFQAGTVMGLAVVGLGLTGIVVLIYWYNYAMETGLLPSGADRITSLLQMIAGMGFGASLIAMFARVGGGIFTKGADVGADLVGKIEAGIPEDDPRNPAVIADNVGDNVGDCAGMGADLFESYVVTLIAAMILGNFVFGIYGVIFPLLIAAGAIVATVFGVNVVKVKEKGDPMAALWKGILVTAVLSGITFAVICFAVLPGDNPEVSQLGAFGASIVGLVVALAIVQITDYFTSTKKKPVQTIAEAAKTGAGTNVIAGLAVGLKSTGPFAIVIVLGIFLAFKFAGVFGVAVAAMAMLSLTGIIVAVDTFGPVSDNAGGIVEMSNMPKSVRDITDKLDAVGNTTKATTKGFAIASAGLAALALLLAFAQEVNIAAEKIGVAGLAVVGGLPVINIMEPAVLIGLLIGGVLPFVFSAYSMMAVAKAAEGIIIEVRRQFRTMKGIMKGTQKPDYARCVDIVTKASLGELLVPGLLAVGTPLVIGFALGPAAVGGFLAGALISGQFIAVFMSTSGGAWDNAKKYIERGAFGGKGSDAHKAAVVGDTVGDPLKDTSGPALNPMIKILNTISLLFVALFVKYSLHLI